MNKLLVALLFLIACVQIYAGQPLANEPRRLGSLSAPLHVDQPRTAYRTSRREQRWSTNSSPDLPWGHNT
jgi:hypothetical protein